jgi:hypothetical protein
VGIAQPVAETIRTRVETGAQHDELLYAFVQCRFEPVVNESRARDQRSSRAGNFDTLSSLFVWLLESRYQGMIRQQVAFFRTEESFGKPIRIAHMGIGLTCTKSARCGGPDRSS